MRKRIYVEVSPDETHPGLSERFEVRFSAPVSGDWLLQVIDRELQDIASREEAEDFRARLARRDREAIYRHAVEVSDKIKRQIDAEIEAGE